MMFTETTLSAFKAYADLNRVIVNIFMLYMYSVKCPVKYFEYVLKHITYSPHDIHNHSRYRQLQSRQMKFELHKKEIYKF